ncbi:MAG: hypothetical protein ACXVKA_12360 [Acidimicrobiia bacterium]
MRPLTDLFGASQFSTGFVVGIVTLLVTFPAALGLAALFPRRGHRPGLAGPGFTVATLVALGGVTGTDLIQSIPNDVLLGLALLWLAGAVAARTQAPWLVGPVAALPGAIVLAGANVGLQAAWVPVVIALGAAVIGATAADFDRRTARYGLGPLLFFIAVFGIYITVPDTELMRAAVGVALPLVFLAWPYAAASLGSGGAYAAVGILLWIMPIDGIGRPGSIVGAIGAFALLIGEPLGRVLARGLEGRMRLKRLPIRNPRVTVLGAQVVLMLYATRVAGRVQTASMAFVLLIPGLVASIAFGVFLVIPERRRHRGRKSRHDPSSPQSRHSSGGRGKRRLSGYGSHDDYV